MPLLSPTPMQSASVGLDVDRSSRQRVRSFSFLAWLLLPFVFYLTPLVFGYAWNSLSEQHNVLDPPEGYSGRLPDMRITVEAWVASVLTVPLHARLNEYIHALELPLWNPYQGLGESYQAQGDGSPYFPVSMLRSLLPYSLSNYVTFATYYVSAVFMYLFLRGEGLSDRTSIVGGIAWVLSGALSLHIPRPEFSDQIIMIPVLFWAAARALRRRDARTYVIFAFVTGLTVIAGHIQIAMIVGVVLALFLVVYAATLSDGPRTWFRLVAASLGVFVVGLGLAGFYLLPLAEGLRISYNKDPNLLSFTPTPFTNVVAFFFPLLFGQPFNGVWLPGDDTQSIAWDNLHAYVGTTLLFVIVAGGALLFRKSPRRGVHAFFLVMGVALAMRYISAPPVAAIDLLPVLGRQSPKHGTEIMAFCFIVAAAFTIQDWRSIHHQTLRWILLGTLVFVFGSVLTLIGKQGGFGQLHADDATRFTALTLFVVMVLSFVVLLANGWQRIPPEASSIVLGGALLAELSMYVMLGDSAPASLYVRLVLFGAILVGAVLLALRMRWAAAAIGALTVVGYAALVTVPSVGLARQFDIDTPPHCKQWLKDAAGENYRSFGIAPNFSSIDAVQDLSAVGPLAPVDFYNFVQSVSTPAVISRYGDSTTFTLSGLYIFPLDQYTKAKAIFDWVGVKYLVMDRNHFGTYAPQDFLGTGVALHQVYHDDSATILQSDAAAPKAEFSGRVQGVASEQGIVQLLQADPSRISGPPLLRVDSIPASLRVGLETGAANSVPVQVVDYRPNNVRLRVSAPSAGVVILKDSYFPGWSATINGQPTDIVSVNAMVRGVIVPGPGDYAVEFQYLPASFVQGVWLSASVLVFLLLVLAWTAIDRPKRRTHTNVVAEDGLADQPTLVGALEGGAAST
jgi:hypothetical protein